MDGSWLRRERARRGWTQAQAAEHVGVSQTYLSLVEHDRRPVSRSLARRLQRHFSVPPTVLPVESERAAIDAQALARDLSALGYPGFAHVQGGRGVNPAQVLAAALRVPDLEPRLSEALPWVVGQYADLDWPWLVAEAKQYDLQNRLGFVVGLAREVAARQERAATATALAAVEASLEPSRLAREDTLCRQSMTQAERRWLREHRPALAVHWNLLTGLVPDHLSYAA